MKAANFVTQRINEEVAQQTFAKAGPGKNPEFYKTVTFEVWIGYPLRTEFIRKVDGIYHLTVRGQLFLKFLVDERISDFRLQQNVDK